MSDLTPEQAAIIDVLREGPKDLDAPLDRTPVGFPVVDPEDDPPLMGDLPPATIDTLLASGHVVRTERECEVCGAGWWVLDFSDDEDECLHCTDGKQTVYELASGLVASDPNEPNRT